MRANEEHFDRVSPFSMAAKYSEIYADTLKKPVESHIHAECEIYVNLSGDVSFMVEGNLYPIKYGDIIIARPFEYHHCVYHSNKLHKHFWILFSSVGNEFLLEPFFKREPGSGNHLSLPPEKTEELISLCFRLTEQEPSQSRKYFNFFKLMQFLQNTEVKNDTGAKYPADVYYAVRYINEHFSEAISVHEIAKGAFVSINTLERHFKEALQITPSAYIKKKRLANAAKFLLEGYSVTETASKSGFSDYSNFIALFKKTYGLTPLQYKKEKRKI